MSQNMKATQKHGDTGLELPALCFGSSALGNMPEVYGFNVGAEQAKETLRAIFAGPHKFIDTSRNYGAGRSESLIGEVLAEIGGLPKGFLLSTKLDRDPDTNEFDAVIARRSLEQSLEALGLSRVSILHLHDPEHTIYPEKMNQPGGALTELHKMKEEGLTDAIGLAAGNTEVMMPILRDWDLDVMITHNRYTLVNRHAGPMIDLAQARNVAVINAAPFGSGVLAKGTAAYPHYAYQDASDDVLSGIRNIEAICARYNVPLGAVALQFSMRDPKITTTLLGVSKVERIDQIKDWADMTIADELWREVMELPFDTSDPEAARVVPPAR